MARGKVQQMSVNWERVPGIVRLTLMFHNPTAINWEYYHLPHQDRSMKTSNKRLGVGAQECVQEIFVECESKW